MKKIISIILALSLFVCAAISMTSCGGATCTEGHVDETGNGYCDVCGEKVTIECTNHTDANSNRMCDICGECIHEVPENESACEWCGACIVHNDNNGDDKCDECNTAFDFACEEASHADKDGNHRCDKCGKCLDHDGKIIGAFRKFDPNDISSSRTQPSMAECFIQSVS